MIESGRPNEWSAPASELSRSGPMPPVDRTPPRRLRLVFDLRRATEEPAAEFDVDDLAVDPVEAALAAEDAAAQLPPEPVRFGDPAPDPAADQVTGSSLLDAARARMTPDDRAFIEHWGRVFDRSTDADVRRQATEAIGSRVAAVVAREITQANVRVTRVNATLPALSVELVQSTPRRHIDPVDTYNALMSGAPGRISDPEPVIVPEPLIVPESLGAPGPLTVPESLVVPESVGAGAPLLVAARAGVTPGDRASIDRWAAMLAPGAAPRGADEAAEAIWTRVAVVVSRQITRATERRSLLDGLQLWLWHGLPVGVVTQRRHTMVEHYLATVRELAGELLAALPDPSVRTTLLPDGRPDDSPRGFVDAIFTVCEQLELEQAA